MPDPGMSLGIMILAAGASRRFGAADKMLALLDGRPVLDHVLGAASCIGADASLVVASSEPVARLGHDAGFAVEMVPPGLPQSASLKAGLSRLDGMGVTRLLVMLGDMPWIEAGDLRALLSLAGNGAACASSENAPMPPALFPASMFGALGAVDGDRGAGHLLRAIPESHRLRLPAERLRDIDLRSDLPDPAARQGRQSNEIATDGQEAGPK